MVTCIILKKKHTVAYCIAHLRYYCKLVILYRSPIQRTIRSIQNFLDFNDRITIELFILTITHVTKKVFLMTLNNRIYYHSHKMQSEVSLSALGSVVNVFKLLHVLFCTLLKGKYVL
jgi:hypothetical protein